MLNIFVNRSEAYSKKVPFGDKSLNSPPKTNIQPSEKIKFNYAIRICGSRTNHVSGEFKPI